MGLIRKSLRAYQQVFWFPTTGIHTIQGESKKQRRAKATMESTARIAAPLEEQQQPAQQTGSAFRIAEERYARGDEPGMAGRNKGRDKLVESAKPVLEPGEEVLDATTARFQVKRMGTETKRNGVLIVTNRRVILFTKKMGGYDMQDCAFGLLASVEHKKGITFGSLSLAASGGHSHVSMVPKDDVARVAQLIRERMALAQGDGQAQPATAPTSDGEDVATTIRSLAALRDEGHITADEFEAKKKQLLGL